MGIIRNKQLEDENIFRIIDQSPNLMNLSRVSNPPKTGFNFN